MATLLKEAFVHQVLKSLPDGKAKDLLDLINNSNAVATVVRLEPNFPNSLSTTNKGVSYVSMVLNQEQNLIVTGFLCYSNTKCGLFTFSGKQEEMCSVEINPTNRTYKYLYEGLDIEEFRREITDIVIAGGDVQFDAHDLIKLMQGNLGVSVDLNQQQTKVVAGLDMTGAVVNSLLVAGSSGESVSWKTLEAALKATAGEDEGKFMTLLSTGIAWRNIPTPETVRLTSLSLTASSGVYTSSQVFTNDIHIVVECEMSGTHACFGLDLHRYDAAISYGVARINWGGTISDVLCHLDSNGHVVLDLASLTGLTTVIAKYYSYN